MVVHRWLSADQPLGIAVFWTSRLSSPNTARKLALVFTGWRSVCTFEWGQNDYTTHTVGRFIRDGDRSTGTIGFCI